MFFVGRTFLSITILVIEFLLRATDGIRANHWWVFMMYPPAYCGTDIFWKWIKKWNVNSIFPLYRLLVSSPWSGFPKNRMGDVYKCSVGLLSSQCSKLSLASKSPLSSIISKPFIFLSPTVALFIHIFISSAFKCFVLVKNAQAYLLCARMLCGLGLSL